MTTSSKSLEDKVITGELSSERVQQYLLDNPSFLYGFLEAQPEVLAAIQLPKSQQIDAVSSLAQKQAQVLRSRKANSDAKLIEFVENVTENDRLFHQTRGFVLAIMRCTSSSALLETIREQFQNEFDVEFTCSELTNSTTANDKHSFLKASGKNQLFKGIIRCEESNVLFNHDKARSAVVLSRTLNSGKTLFIAVGNSHPDFYSQNIGIDFIEFLTDSAAEMLNTI